jgi:hypothetical protein
MDGMDEAALLPKKKAIGLFKKAVSLLAPPARCPLQLVHSVHCVCPFCPFARFYDKKKSS